MHDVKENVDCWKFYINKSLVEIYCFLLCKTKVLRYDDP